MDRETVDGAKSIAKGVVNDVLGDMRKGFGVGRQSRGKSRLSTKEQLDIFLNMSEKQLDEIRREKGEKEYMKYIYRMNALMEERNA